MSRDKSLRDQPNATHLSKIELTEEELNRVSGGGMSSVSAAINTIGKALASSASKGWTIKIDAKTPAIDRTGDLSARADEPRPRPDGELDHVAAGSQSGKHFDNVELFWLRGRGSSHAVKLGPVSQAGPFSWAQVVTCPWNGYRLERIDRGPPLIVRPAKGLAQMFLESKSWRNETEASRKTAASVAPEQLTATSDENTIALTEQELRRVSGGFFKIKMAQ